ncbi:hypothetical protein ACFYOV_04330 [Streptomyces sp. NPDC005931]|uniref:hypothetical protein n=1 Tax=Streptomyces sp. NPDC005931 TaxID=3364737 RepID=UPI003676B361
MRDHFGYSATWLPTVGVRLGDVGRLTGYVYDHLGSLQDHGIGFRTRKEITEGSLSYVSTEGVRISSRAHADVQALGSPVSGGMLSVSFASEGAVLFQAEGCVSEVIDGQREVEQEVLKLHERGAWPKHAVVVTEVVHAARATILIAGGADATIELRGAADLAGLAAAGSRLEVASQQNIATQIVGEGNLTPLFRAKGVRKRLLGRADVVRRGNGRAPNPSVRLKEMDYADFADVDGQR